MKASSSVHHQRPEAHKANSATKPPTSPGPASPAGGLVCENCPLHGHSGGGSGGRGGGAGGGGLTYFNRRHHPFHCFCRALVTTHAADKETDHQTRRHQGRPPSHPATVPPCPRHTSRARSTGTTHHHQHHQHRSSRPDQARSRSSRPHQEHQASRSPGSRPAGDHLLDTPSKRSHLSSSSSSIASNGQTPGHGPPGHPQMATPSGQRYELSQEMIDKRVQLLERQYGGQRARDSALVIQKAFRGYQMKRRFESMSSRRSSTVTMVSRMVVSQANIVQPISVVTNVQKASQRISISSEDSGFNAKPSPVSFVNSSSVSRDIQSPVGEPRVPGSANNSGDSSIRKRNSSISVTSSESSSSCSSSSSNMSLSDSFKARPPSGHCVAPKPSLVHQYSMSSSTSNSSSSSFMQRSPPLPAIVVSNCSFNGNGSSGNINSNHQRFSNGPQVAQQAHIEVVRKRQYRVGLNLFNKHPAERGIQFLIQNGFIDSVGPSSSTSFSDHQEALAASVAHFLLTRKGLSKQMIGEYLGNLQSPFNQQVLEQFVKEVDVTGLPVDMALRKFQMTFRFPGEAQKIERLVERFSYRYLECNAHLPRARADASTNSNMTRDEVFILSFAIIMLNTDLHVPNLKTRMTLAQWFKNLRGAFPGGDLSEDYLTEIYERVKNIELKTGSDHVTQVMKVQQTLVPGNTKQTSQVPNLYQSHRRLVCYCRLYEVYDIARKERQGQHQREIFLFNDLLLVTKIYKKNVQTADSKAPACKYSYRGSFSLSGLAVILFAAPHYSYGIRLQRKLDDKVVMTFNARNEHDRARFVEDLKESIEEMDQMESIRIGLRTVGGSGLSLDCNGGQNNCSAKSGAPADNGSLSVRGSGLAKASSLLELSVASGDIATSPCCCSTDVSASAHAAHVPRDSSSSAINHDQVNGTSVGGAGAHGKVPMAPSATNGTSSKHDLVVARRASNGSPDSGLSLSRDNSPKNVVPGQCPAGAEVA